MRCLCYHVQSGKFLYIEGKWQKQINNVMDVTLGKTQLMLVTLLVISVVVHPATEYQTGVYSALY